MQNNTGKVSANLYSERQFKNFSELRISLSLFIGLQFEPREIGPNLVDLAALLIWHGSRHKLVGKSGCTPDKCEFGWYFLANDSNEIKRF